MKSFATLLGDLGGILAAFGAADPGVMNSKVVKALPTVVATAQAGEAAGSNTQQLLAVGIAGAEAVANQELTGGAANTAAAVEQSLPSLMQFVSDLFETHTAATAAAPQIQGQTPPPAA